MHYLSLHRLTAYAAATIPLATSLPAMAVGLPTKANADFSEKRIPQTALATAFGLTSVPQNKFVAVAVPRDAGYYNLLILEQISSSKSCWKEHGSSPTEIEPLLLKFDFTGICGRSTDSNGYSIRQAGKDLGLDYRLTLQKQGNDLVLLGKPNSSRVGQPMEIGRTQGMGAGLLKIHLNSGWQFAKRTYKGKTLGHVYLNTNQTQLPAVAGRRLSPPRPSAERIPITTASRSSTAVDIPVPFPGAAKTPPRLAIANRSGFAYRVVVQPSDSEQQDQIKSLVPDAFRSTYQGRSVMQVGLFNSRSKVDDIVKLLKRNDLRPEIIENDRSQPSSVPSAAVASRAIAIPVPSPDSGRQFQSAARPSSSSKLYRIVVQPRDSKQKSKIKSLVPDSFRSSYRGQSVMQVGLFDNRSKVDYMVKLMKRNGLKPEVIEDSRQRLSLQTIPASVGMLPVPSSSIPMGRADNGSDIYAGLPPAPPSSAIALGPRYRVVVSTFNSRQQSKLKGLVPGAFRSSYQGRTVVQVGSFASIQEAQARMQLIQRHGMNPILEKTQ